MAKIIKTQAQEDALKTIQKNIRKLEEVNRVLNHAGTQAEIIVIAGKEKMKLPVEKSYSDELLQSIRKRMVTETKMLSKKYSIVLDEGEQLILENRSFPLPEKRITDRDISGCSFLPSGESGSEEAVFLPTVP